jgi:hypothetical protein
MTEHRYMHTIERHDRRPNAFSPTDASAYAALRQVYPAEPHANTSGDRSWRQRRSHGSHIDSRLPPR